MRGPGDRAPTLVFLEKGLLKGLCVFLGYHTYGYTKYQALHKLGLGFPNPTVTLYYAVFPHPPHHSQPNPAEVFEKHSWEYIEGVKQFYENRQRVLGGSQVPIQMSPSFQTPPSHPNSISWDFHVPYDGPFCSQDQFHAHLNGLGLFPHPPHHSQPNPAEIFEKHSWEYIEGVK